jgi:hypothetical protein
MIWLYDIITWYYYMILYDIILLYNIVYTHKYSHETRLKSPSYSYIIEIYENS